MKVFNRILSDYSKLVVCSGKFSFIFSRCKLEKDLANFSTLLYSFRFTLILQCLYIERVSVTYVIQITVARVDPVCKYVAVSES